MAFIALYSVLSPRIDAISDKQFEDHGALTASIGDISNIKDQVDDIHRVIYQVAPNWGVNPNAGKTATTSDSH